MMRKYGKKAYFFKKNFQDASKYQPHALPISNLPFIDQHMLQALLKSVSMIKVNRLFLL